MGCCCAASCCRCRNCSSVQLMRRDPKCLLMAPMQMSFGFVAAMLNGWVNGVAVERGVRCCSSRIHA
jgi:hypothetical protein